VEGAAAVALKAAAYCVLVTPTGDSDQVEHGRLTVVRNAAPEQKILRGVVLHVGPHVQSDIDRGDVAHYHGFHEILDGQETRHVVPQQYLLAVEDDE
jgi:hypothetical protein